MNVFLLESRVQYECIWFSISIRLWSHLIPTFYVSAKELLKQAVVFSCEIICDSISTPIYELQQTDVMLIKERLQIWCRGNNGFNPGGIECKIMLLSFYIILINSSPPVPHICANE